MVTPAKILIVDDDEAICELVSEGLSEGGYTCCIALTADEALTNMQHYHFDVALLDIKLPGRSGIDLIRTFQTLSQNTKIVMMTAVKDLDTAIQVMKLGASDYLVKPFTIDKLSASISIVLDNSKRYSPVSAIINHPTGNISNSAKTVNQSLGTISAIAYGVDAQVDYFDFHSKIVTDQTIELARRFCLPSKEIEKWADARNKLSSKRDENIKSILSELERRPLLKDVGTHSVHPKGYQI